VNKKGYGGEGGVRYLEVEASLAVAPVEEEWGVDLEAEVDAVAHAQHGVAQGDTLQGQTRKRKAQTSVR
jgi:hypothetical protein